MNTIQFILGISAIIFTWCVLFAMFTGVGLAVQRLLGLRKFDADHCLMAFWTGLASIIAFLQLWHLKMPVNLLAFAIVLAIGLTGLVWNRRGILCWLKQNLAGKRWVLVTMLCVTFWLANRSAGPCTTIDTGLYHLSGVRWITAHPIIPGLGNLHGRFAFNNASFLYAALLETGPWYGRSNHLANGLLLTVLAAQCLLAAFRLSQPRCRKFAVSLFNLFLLTPLVLTAVHSWIASHSTDLPTVVFSFAAVTRMFAFLLQDKKNLKDHAYEVIFVLMVLATGMCVKASLVFFFLTASSVTIVVWLHRAWEQRKLAIITVFKAIAMAGLLAVPWSVRSVILSGYPAYPSTFAAMPVSWKVPENLARWDTDAIRIAARRAQELGGWQWILPWLRHLERDIVLPIIIVTIGAAVLMWLTWTKRRPRPGTTAVGWLLPLITLASIAFWFFIAPARRFGYFLFWILAGTFLAMLFHRYAPVERQKLRSMVLIVCLIFSAVNIKKFFVMPPESGWLYQIPTVAVDSFTTSSGLEVYLPAEGQFCWDMQLPCTPYPRENLRLRRKGDLRSGFVLDGPTALPSEKNPSTKDL